MRWRVLTAVLLIVALLAGGIAFRWVVNDTCRRVENLLRQSGPLEEAQALWERRLPLLSCVITHDRLERVGEGLARANGYLQTGEQAGFRVQIEGLLYLLDDIREYDHINVQTLL